MYIYIRASRQTRAAATATPFAGFPTAAQACLVQPTTQPTGAGDTAACWLGGRLHQDGSFVVVRQWLEGTWKPGWAEPPCDPRCRLRRKCRWKRNERLPEPRVAQGVVRRARTDEQCPPGAPEACEQGRWPQMRDHVLVVVAG